MLNLFCSKHQKLIINDMLDIYDNCSTKFFCILILKI